MRRFLSILAAILTVAGIGVLSTGSASALGGESLGCVVSPTGSTVYDNPCYDGGYASSYLVVFQVLNETGSSSYSWSVPTSWAGRVSGGCTSTRSDCRITATSSTGTQRINMSVTLTQGGVSETLSATAYIEPWCGAPC